MTLHDIRRMTNRRTYDKGVDLYNKNRFITFYNDVEEDVNHIHGLIKGSGRNEYVVDMIYDDITDEILEYGCECPAFYNYEGPCKHVVAAMLQYMDEASEKNSGFIDGADNLKAKLQSRTDTMDDYGEASIKAFLENLRGMGSLYNQPKQQPRTTPEIGKLFQSSNHYDFRPLLGEVSLKAIRLEPYIKVSANIITVEFKIGHERMYVLKDIWAFYTRMKQQSHYVYGKSLDFTHKIDVFDDNSKEMVRFIIRMMDHMRSPYQYGYQIKRELTLDVDELAGFLGTITEGAVQVSLGWQMSPKAYGISYEKIDRKMTIEGMEDGLELTVEQRLGYAGEGYYIYFIDETVYICDINTIEPIKDFLMSISRYDDRKVFIAKEDVNDFCLYLLPTLEDYYAIDRVNFTEEAYAMQEASFELYLDLPEHDVITCKVMAIYGDRKCNLFDSEDSGLRDCVTEKKVNQGVSAYFNGYDMPAKQLYLHGDERWFYEFLTEGLVELQSYGEVFVSDKLKKINVVSHSPVKVGVSIESDLLELNIHSEDLSPKQLTEILMHYNPKKKYYRLKNGDFINVEDGALEVLHELTNGLNLTKKDLSGQTISLPKYRALYIDEQLKKGHGGPVAKDKSFKSLIRHMKTVEENEFDIPVSLDSTLRTYQKSGFIWMKTLKENGFGGILADDMGLGKTLQVITLLKSEHLAKQDPGRALIVCPSSLVYNWYREFEKFAPEMVVTTVTGSPAVREKLISEADVGGILVTSYDLLKRDIDYYKEQTFAYQIIDEAQYIKNSNTQVAKAVKTVQAGFKLALTGTPIENRLSELWSIFDYLMPGFLYSYKKFKSDLEVPVVQSQDEHVTGRLRQMITPFVLRRLKKDVLTDLPDKIEEDVIILIDGEQRQLYDARVALLKNELNNQSAETYNTSKIKVLAELTRLRQLCCDPALVYDNYKDGSAKIEMCMNLIQEAVDGGHKVLLFSQFTSLFESIQHRLDAGGISYFTLTGKTSKEKRMKLVESFNVDKTSVFCISLKAGGTGLNLTSADIVIHFDPWWNVAVQNQATDRAHRIGQKNVVNVYKLIVKDSIEEKIVALQERKKALADKMLTGEKIGVASFSKEELLEILG